MKMMSQMRLLSKMPIELQFYIPKKKTVSIGYKVIRLTNCRTLKSWARWRNGKNKVNLRNCS